MLSASSPLPFICVSPASPEKDFPEPYSPIPSAKLDRHEGDDGFRAKHLTPPPVAIASPWNSSPLRPADCPSPKGVDREQFDLLLKASRDRRALLGTQKTPDLRKELALKNQRTKQLERRARFLFKVKEPPSPTAVSTPKTPPESPSIFHCSLPSPGLKSPLSAFESVVKGSETLLDIDYTSSNTRQGWVEQVEFLLPTGGQPHTATKANMKLAPSTQTKSKKGVPSLDEITARLKLADQPAKQSNCQSRLPNFLKTASRLSSPALAEARPKLNVGRLHLPVRSLSMDDAKFDIAPAQRVIPPQSPNLCAPLEVRTTLIPRTVSVATVALNESNLRAFGRSNTARDMMQTLKRRSSPPPPGLGYHVCTQTSIKLKRHSAPAELQVSGRVGFNHAVLSMPGGF
ncbi:hypothetical protein PAXINDRAFT_65019 [Paxillus involutus ATCC 200175]|nr:hypothetical protein PAXINDRAFT_65019 [Paxillus involutus ATCC 200175]